MSYIYALSAAFLFALSVPLGKTLLNSLKPLELSALCYLGGGGGLLIYKLLSGRAERGAGEAPFEKKDLPYVAGFTVAGGVLAPAFLFTGLNLSSSSAASLLLNFELVFTALIAVLFFKEHGGWRFWLAAFLVTAGGMALSFEPATATPGLVFVALSSLMWALDNNLTARVSLKDPVNLGIIKGLAGGSVTLCLAFYSGGVLPALKPLVLALMLGFVGYGVSLVLLIRAMRELGASRAGAFFGIYPFIGAALSFLWLGESADARFAAAFVLMGLAAALLLGEKHGHAHDHTAIEHVHSHLHDCHHAHVHGPAAPDRAAHTHAHIHEPVRHTHEHMPDSHHRHEHN
ncbi:MAG: hypothetical protein A2270_05770 [Elusimicrobia bacterium RIFOXYA12_FULL_51_18]|nr:MAG: hypothetical protein A2270_05770 [Elusimicrobia bacterium RIFOXYA12_FULL_51_18]OGS31567.1 MAG: hypothetical protein A2218_03550 [Elusimicrobia bacterium RIFOXYA2_FULL_53_38]